VAAYHAVLAAVRLYVDRVAVRHGPSPASPADRALARLSLDKME
jgi:hypothetical protein